MEGVNKIHKLAIINSIDRFSEDYSSLIIVIIKNLCINTSHLHTINNKIYFYTFDISDYIMYMKNINMDFINKHIDIFSIITNIDSNYMSYHFTKNTSLSNNDIIDNIIRFPNRIMWNITALCNRLSKEEIHNIIRYNPILGRKLFPNTYRIKYMSLGQIEYLLENDDERVYNMSIYDNENLSIDIIYKYKNKNWNFTKISSSRKFCNEENIKKYPDLGWSIPALCKYGDISLKFVLENINLIKWNKEALVINPSVIEKYKDLLDNRNFFGKEYDKYYFSNPNITYEEINNMEDINYLLLLSNNLYMDEYFQSIYYKKRLVKKYINDKFIDELLGSNVSGRFWNYIDDLEMYKDMKEYNDYIQYINKKFSDIEKRNL